MQEAGSIGAPGYSGDGVSALSASFTNVYGMQEITSGTYQGDILIWDSDKLRIFTVGTESADPYIYDVVDLNIVTGYSASTEFYSVYYDESTEQNSVFGSGNIYFYTSANGLQKITFTESLGAITGGALSTYSLNGLSLGDEEIALTPAGLLFTDKEKARILSVTP